MAKPLKFKTPAALDKKIREYFQRTPQEEWTVTGLGLVIGSKQLLNDYEKRERYGEIVTTAKLMIENSYELSLRRHGRTADIFGLKNFGWRDKTEVDQKSEVTGKDGGPIEQKWKIEFKDVK